MYIEKKNLLHPYVFLYLLSWYSLCDIHFQISTVILKTKSKIITVYLKNVLQQEKKKRNPSLLLNNEIELNMGPNSILSNGQAMLLIHC